MTAEIVNLKRARKQLTRASKDKRAEENRRRFGASKAQRAEAEADRNQTDRALDGAERQPAQLNDDHDDLDPGNAS